MCLEPSLKWWPGKKPFWEKRSAGNRFAKTLVLVTTRRWLFGTKGGWIQLVRDLAVAACSRGWDEGGGDGARVLSGTGM